MTAILPIDPSYRVLLIEEDQNESELYAEMIRDMADCQVDVMTRVESSGEWLAHSNYHLVVFDFSQRETAGGGAAERLSGLAALERIKRFSPETAVILISEQATVEQAVAAIRMGAEDYLKKPFNPEAFKLAVKRGLDRKAVFGENAGASSFLSLLNSCQMISATLEQDRIFGMIKSYFSRELKSDHSMIYVLNEGEPARFEESSRMGGPDRGQNRAMEEVLDIALRATNPLPHMVSGGEFYRFVERGQLTPGLFAFRFRCAGPSDYFCVSLSPERPASIEAFEGRLKMLKAQIEVTGKNIERYQGVQNLVYVDDATGLYNTRYLNFILDREINLARAHNRSFAVLFIDADKFKQVNDKHGHLVGTKLLNALGALLKKLVREADTVFRYGGDEFVAVLSSCDLATAKVVAERIRRTAEQHVFLESEGLNLRFTVTIGVALFPDHANSKKEIIDAADQAMYCAKRASRNSVTVATATVSDGDDGAIGG